MVYVGKESQGLDFASDGFAAEAPEERQPLATKPIRLTDNELVYVTLFWRLVGEGAEEWKCREFVYNGIANNGVANEIARP